MSHYRFEISDDFEKRIIDNMPPQAVRKLLSQLLARYSQIVGMDINADMDEISCVYALKEQLDKRGI